MRSILFGRDWKLKKLKQETIESAEELETYMNEYEYPPDAMLTLAAADVKSETME